MSDASREPSHRERLLEGMAASIRERGYRETTIAEIVRHARTSRRSFYEQFEDRDACFLALFDALNAKLAEEVAAAVDPEAPWSEQVDQAIGAYIDAIAGEPELIVSFIRELPGLGAVGSARQRAAIEAFAALLVRLSTSGGMRRAGVATVSTETAILLVGGLRELVAYVVESGGEPASIRDVAADAVKGVVDPARAPQPR